MKNSIILITSIFFLIDAHADDRIQYDLQIDGITCPFCVATSEQALKKIDGIEVISSNLETGVISVCGKNSLTFDEQQLTKLFRNKGFTYRGLTQVDSCSIDISDSQEKASDLTQTNDANTSEENKAALNHSHKHSEAGKHQHLETSK